MAKALTEGTLRHRALRGRSPSPSKLWKDLNQLFLSAWSAAKLLVMCSSGFIAE
jgi:hypothetical protein